MPWQDIDRPEPIEAKMGSSAYVLGNPPEALCLPAKPQCWKCDSFEIHSSKVGPEIWRECADCGATWKDKAGL